MELDSLDDEVLSEIEREHRKRKQDEVGANTRAHRGAKDGRGLRSEAAQSSGALGKLKAKVGKLASKVIVLSGNCSTWWPRACANACTCVCIRVRVHCTPWCAVPSRRSNYAQLLATHSCCCVYPSAMTCDVSICVRARTFLRTQSPHARTLCVCNGRAEVLLVCPLMCCRAMAMRGVRLQEGVSTRRAPLRVGRHVLAPGRRARCHEQRQR